MKRNMPEVDVHDFTPGSDILSNPSTPNECNDEEAQAMTPETKSESDTGEGKETDEEEEWADILQNGELKMKVLRKGEENSRPESSDICHVKLVGKLDDGKIVEEYDDLKVQMGYCEVVQGLELALSAMNVGEEACIIIAPRFAYGSIGNPPHIPPNATITYTVELLKVDMEPNLEKVPYEERIEIANSKRERGNWWYSRQDTTKAVQCYRKALDILDENIPYVDDDGKTHKGTEEMIKKSIREKLKIYNNLAAGQLMMGAYDTALSSVNEVVKNDPTNVKALFRKSKILSAKGCVNEAVVTLREALLLEPENTAVKMELSKCVKLQQIERQHEKILYKKMLGQNSKNSKSTEVLKGRSRLWTKVLGTAATATLMAAVAVAISYKFKNYSFL